MSASIQVIAKYQMAEKVSEANGATFAEIAHSTGRAQLCWLSSTEDLLHQESLVRL